MARSMSKLQIVGRNSSLYTRMPLIYAEELGVPYEVVPIYDMTEVGPEAYAGNPALKLPILRTEAVGFIRRSEHLPGGGGAKHFRKAHRVAGSAA
ncbi:MAG TPA: glutathione S-transferase N-terminal domain-containing protein [Steroidobacteraceae bacterium]